uniref:uncharacterized protein LOC114602131 n=1 Tax=Podarcis muralis TaxID=64176 RepID=UPI0010A047D7|nr:uncharacterized protein LOC114602131 [Podarcis muralis]
MWSTPELGRFYIKPYPVTSILDFKNICRNITIYQYLATNGVGSRFSVNLVCGNGNIAFHFNPRFDEGRVVVCNTQQHGRWGAEERAYNMPFQPNIYFEMIINVKSHCYQVSVNGNHFLEYRHRLPFHEVQTLQINGDVSLNCISFAGTNPPPPYTPPAYNVVTATTVGGMFAQPNFVQPSFSTRKKKTAQGNSGITLSNPAVPFHIAIPGNFTQFRKITIVGNVPFHSNRFHVNLKNTMSGNIALHINPRLKEGAIVRNTFIHGSWGSEERHLPAMPFSPGQAFHMEITNLKNNYQVTVNGIAIFNYTHRIPSGQVDHLEIAGDVTLSCVQYYISICFHCVFGGQKKVENHSVSSSKCYKMAFSSPILHPSVPFLQYFHAPLRGGMSICIIGQVLHSAKGFVFTVNLLGENGDIVFHFNPRMNENEVVCNTKQNGGWGKEERWPIPFEAGATFMMIIDVMSDCYRVTVNSKDFLKYVHRIPFFSARALEIKGDVNLQRVSRTRSKMSLPIAAAWTNTEGLSDGKRFLIQGFVRPYTKRFAVNFLCANGDIAFHFNPRFDMLKPVVVCNTQMKSEKQLWEFWKSDEVFWGEEEIASSMPFKQNNSFEMTVNLESGCYQVYVNGNHFLEYKHRVPLKEIQTLEVKGDVSVNRFEFSEIKAPPPYSPPDSGDTTYNKQEEKRAPEAKSTK